VENTGWACGLQGHLSLNVCNAKRLALAYA